MYYLRSRAAADAIKFTVDTASLKVIINFFYHNFILELNSGLSVITLILGNTGKAKGGGGR